MKFTIFILIFISAIYAKDQIPSPILPAKNIFMNLDVKKCNRSCLIDLLEQGKIFSFLSVYKNHSEFDDIQNEYDKYASIFHIYIDTNIKANLAMLVPEKVIRRYAISTVNSTLAYLLYKKYNFDLKVYNCTDESETSLLSTLAKIRDDGYKYILAPLTEKGAKIVSQNSDGLIVYIPTVNKKMIKNLNPNIIFGGIDYDNQIQKLLTYATNKVAIFSDSSDIAHELNSYIQNNTQNIVYTKEFKDSRINFKKILKWNKRLDNSSIFLNLPLVKASLLASQLRVYDRTPYNLLSTQINYNPMILTLTQYEDRQALLIANSIGKTDDGLTISNTLLDSDISYNWVNYSTSIGADLLYNNYFLQEAKRNFTEEVKDGQVQYKISIVKPKRYSIEAVTDEGM